MDDEIRGIVARNWPYLLEKLPPEGDWEEIAPLCIAAAPVHRGSSAHDAGDRVGCGSAFCFVSEAAPTGSGPVHYRFGGAVVLAPAGAIE